MTHDETWVRRDLAGSWHLTEAWGFNVPVKTRCGRTVMAHNVVTNLAPNLYPMCFMCCYSKHLDGGNKRLLRRTDDTR